MLEGQTARLSGPALETLAIVAYKQPIARAQISAIRGVNVDATLKTLVARGYVEESGHEHTPGNPTLFSTTRAFLERLGVDSLADLPPLADFVPESSLVEALERGLRGVDVELDEPGRDARAIAVPGAGDEPATDATASGCRSCLARAGFGSRRACEVLIAAGRVTVDGEVAVLGAAGRSRADARSRSTACRWSSTRRSCYWLLNKPAGYVTTASDPQGRPTVLELVPSEPRVFPVGRLDLETEGLLAAHQRRRARGAAHAPAPRRGEGVPRRGRGHAERRPRCAALREGVELDDGPTRAVRGAARAGVAATGASALEIVLKEGRKRIVRRMCAEVGHPVRAARADAHRTAARPEARAGRVPGAHAGRGAGAVRRRSRRARGTPRLTCDPVRVLALRGATTCRREHQGRGRRQDADASSRRCSSATRSPTTTS